MNTECEHNNTSPTLSWRWNAYDGIYTTRTSLYRPQSIGNNPITDNVTVRRSVLWRALSIPIACLHHLLLLSQALDAITVSDLGQGNTSLSA